MRVVNRERIFNFYYKFCLFLLFVFWQITKKEKEITAKIRHVVEAQPNRELYSQNRHDAS